MQESIISALIGNEIFEGLNEEKLRAFFNVCGRVVNVKRGALLPLNHNGECALIISGTAVIYSENNGSRTILRFSVQGNPVGVAGMFLDYPIMTGIEACSEKNLCAVIFTKEELNGMMDKDDSGILRNNLLKLLSKKISFLNKRINTVTSGSAERRLASFILSSENVDGRFDSGMTMKDLANCLDIGRASLYRAAERLSECGAARYEDNCFFILDRDMLHEISIGKK